MFIEVGRLKFELFHDQLPFTSENFRCKVLSVFIDSGHPQQTGYGTPQNTQIVTVSLQHSVHTSHAFLKVLYAHAHTHTCSETSYRITDVECIVRAKTLQLNLTGHSR